MRKYEFSLEKESRRLPPVSKWINPIYNGEISKFDYELGKEVNFPKDWRIDFPTYAYKICEIEKIDYWPYNGESFVKDLSTKFNAEQVNEKWIDFYEIFANTLNEVLIKSTKRRNRTKAYKSFHVNSSEAIFALNHLVRTRHPGAFWQWNATADRVMTKTPYIESNLSNELYKQYPNSWEFGAEGDGDFRSVDNIRSIVNMLELVQLFTAPLSIGSILCMAQILSCDGDAVLYTDQIDTSFKFCMVYILGCCFKTMSVVRPNSNSDDLYYVCEGFRGISKSYIERLEQILRYSRELDVPPALFPKDKISSQFIIEFCDALIKATMRRKKKDISWWVEITGIQPIRDPVKLIN